VTQPAPGQAPPPQREQTDRDAIEVRNDRARRTVASFMRAGSGPSTFKPGLLPGLLGGIAVAFVAAIAVGGTSVAQTALQPGSSGSAGPSGSRVAAGSAGPSIVAPSGLPTGTLSAPTPTPAVETPIVTAPGQGAIASVTVVFAFTSSAQGWTPVDAASAPGFSAQFDGSTGSANPGSLAMSLPATAAAGSSGSVAWNGTWAALKVPAGKNVLSVAATVQCRLDGAGGGASKINQRLDLADGTGTQIRSIASPAACASPGIWTKLSGPAVGVPAAFAASDAPIRLVLGAATDGAGSAQWHWDDVKLTIRYR
jgi:hypothetical protein